MAEEKLITHCRIFSGAAQSAPSYRRESASIGG